MKKVSKLSLTLILMIAVLATSFVSADIQSIKDNYLATEKVYVRSTSHLCINRPKEANVSLYIVENRDEWFGGDVLEDVRGEPQLIRNSQFASEMIWDSSESGFYDIIVDCVENEAYDTLEPTDSLDKVGFAVEMVTGTSKASIGSKDVGDHFWMYDPEAIDLINEMLQISLLAKGEDIELTNMTVQAIGSGNDAELEKIEIYVDENNNGKVDEDEFLIGFSQPAYSDDNGLVTVELEYFLTKDLEENLLVVYTMKDTIEEGEFSLKVESIYGVGEGSGELIKFSGLPMTSGVKTVLPKKTCLGTLNLELEPIIAAKGDRVIARITGLSGCLNKTISLKTNPCGSSIKEEAGSCKVEEEGCEITFKAVKSQTYHACIDKNNDGDSVDLGEYAFTDLIVSELTQEEEGIPEETNVTEEVNMAGEETEEVGEELAGITGEVIEEFRQTLSETSSFFILLEVTLLLILFVLVMIMFRLKPVVEKSSKAPNKTKEKED